MDIKRKCSNCCCTDLEKVDFPYKAKLIQTAIGIAGETNSYDLEESASTDVYICTNCGHFEFFNLKLAELVLTERKENAKIQTKIEELNNQILKNTSEIDEINDKIHLILKQLKNLDITIRQSNELKEQKKALAEKIKALELSNNSLEKQKENLKK